MFIFSPRFIAWLKLSINYADFLKAIPFYWCSNKAENVYFINSARKVGTFAKFDLIVIICRVYLMYLILQLYYLFKSFNIESLAFTLIHFLVLLKMTAMVTLHHICLTHGFVFTRFANEYLELTGYLEMLYGTGIKVRPKWKLHSAAAVTGFGLISVLLPVLSYLFYLYQPYSTFFLTSGLLTKKHLESIHVRLVSGLVTLWIFLASLACAQVFIIVHVVFVYGLIFLLQELRPGTASLFTKSKLRRIGATIRVYHSLQILSVEFNFIYCNKLIMILNNVFCSIAVLSISLAIVFHDQLQLKMFVIIIMAAIISVGYLTLTALKHGQIHYHSKILLGQLSQTINSTTYSGGLTIKRYILKRVNSLRVIAIRQGPFNIYKAGTVLDVLAKLVIFTVRFLVIISKWL